MKRFILCSILLSMTTILIAQDYYIKRINFDPETEVSYRMIHYKGRIFISIGHFCGNIECSSIIELNTDGDTLWRTIVPDIDLARANILIHNDSITITGNNDPFNTAFRMAHYSLNGDKLGSTYTIEDDSLKFESMFQLTTQKVDGDFLVCGSGEREGEECGLIYKTDNKGIIDTILCLEKSLDNSRIWDSFIDQSGRLTTFHEVNLLGGDKYKKIIKLDTNLDTVWSYTTETNSNNNVFPFGTELQDGRIAMSIYTPNTHQVNHSIRVINPDKTISWEFNPPAIGTNARFISRLKVLENGDIIGTGFFQDISLDPEVIRVPWIFRMTSDGQKLWDRVFYEYDPEDDESRNGRINDVIELENGDLMGIGSMQYESDEIIIFKLDENGCIDNMDCDVIHQITSTSEVSENIDVSIYPNPTSEIVTIRNEKLIQNLSVIIIDSHANRLTPQLKVDNSKSIDVSSFSAGIYYLIFSNSKNVTGYKRIVIE